VNRNIATPDPNDFPGEKPYREHPQLSFAGITDGEVGLMVANQGLYEYEVIDNTEHSIAVTLLRCLDRIIGGPIYVSEDLLIPEAQCLGELFV
jgi:alpha-mannosidase